MHEIVEMEVNDYLEMYGYNPEDVKFIRGSALCAVNDENPEMGTERIKELLETMDETIPVPERSVDKPFEMSIE